MDPTGIDETCQGFNPSALGMLMTAMRSQYVTDDGHPNFPGDQPMHDKHLQESREHL